MKRIYRAAALILICAAMCAALAGCGNAEEKELIGRAAAREIALKDAGFPARWVIQLDADLVNQLHRGGGQGGALAFQPQFRAADQRLHVAPGQVAHFRHFQFGKRAEQRNGREDCQRGDDHVRGADAGHAERLQHAGDVDGVFD